MPIIPYIVTIDPVLGTATLSIQIDGTVTIAFAFANNRVTAPARPKVEMTRAQTREANANILQWLELVRNRLPVTPTPISRFKLEYEKRKAPGPGAQKVEYSGEMAGTNFGSGEWNPQTNVVEFGPRPALDLAYSDFLKFMNIVREFLNLCDEF